MSVPVLAERSRTGVPQPRRSRTVVDAAVMLAYLVAAVVVLGGLWLNLDTGYLVNSMQDQNMWEWFFAVTAKNVVELDNPLFTSLQNVPLGVNLMANTAMLGLGIPLTPVTLIFGPTVTWALVLTGGLAGTAAAWYWVLSRHIANSRVGAAIGGAFCGFAPSIISHANAHPNFVALFVVPLIVLWVIRLTKATRPVHDGVVLGLLLTFQVFLGEEALLITVTAGALFFVVYALSAPVTVGALFRPLAIGLGTATGVLLVAVAYPLWWQFWGPQSYAALEHGPVGNDAAAFTAYAAQSLAGQAAEANHLSMNRTEQNAFFGVPLVVLVLGVSVWLWRVVPARAAAVAMLALAWLSMGVLVVVHDTGTSIPGPWMLLSGLPLYESLLESRLALGCVPLIGVLLALGTDRVLAIALAEHWRFVLRVGWFGLLALALLPLIPAPLETTDRATTPAFFTGSAWRGHVDPGGSVVVAPLPDAGQAQALRWQADAGLEFPLAEGYFVGPGDSGRQGTYGAVRRPTSELLDDVSESGEVPTIGPDERRQALDDLRYWHADVVVAEPDAEQGPVRTTVTRLLGVPGRYVDGLWVWDVRGLTP